jgi:hypothetical protein
MAQMSRNISENTENNGLDVVVTVDFTKNATYIQTIHAVLLYNQYIHPIQVIAFTLEGLINILNNHFIISPQKKKNRIQQKQIQVKTKSRFTSSATNEEAYETTSTGD